MVITKKITLEKYGWEHADKIHVTGYCWQEDIYIAGRKFIHLINQHIGQVDGFIQWIQQLNGQFSVIAEIRNSIILYCSHSWQYPIFYSQINDNLMVTDSPERLLNTGGVMLNTTQENYFQLFGVTANSQTLIKNVHQVLPGELVRFNEDGGKNSQPINLKTKPTENTTKEEVAALLTDSFKKFFTCLKDKPVIVPLTKGYDSRLLVCLLKLFAHNNVTCITWGREGNIEVPTARKVAGRLDFKHLFIPYSEDLIYNFTDDPGFLPFINYAGHMSSMPFLQDYFAIKYIKENKLVPNDAVFLPGHPGDYLRGAHLREDCNQLNTNKLISQLIEQFGSSASLKKKQQNILRKQINQEFFTKKGKAGWQIFNGWDYQERQCKFIGNSCHIFPFMGYKHMLPLFDKDLLNYFNSLSFQIKTGQLYNEVLEEYFFKKLQVDFDLKPYIKSIPNYSPIKHFARKLIPKYLKSLYYNPKDTIFYYEITRSLIQSDSTHFYRKPLIPSNYNYYIIQWYLNKVKSMLKE